MYFSQLLPKLNNEQLFVHFFYARGVPVRDVDGAARAALDRHGILDAFKHGLGHGTGLQIHESPRMSPISHEILASGMIITVEPGVYYDGDFGIRIEDDVLVTEKDSEVLSSAVPKERDEMQELRAAAFR